MSHRWATGHDVWLIYTTGLVFGAGVMTGVMCVFGAFWFLRAFWISIEENGRHLD